MKYETFMTEELPAFLESAFGVPGGGRDRTGIVGVGMGAYSAMNLASKHPRHIPFGAHTQRVLQQPVADRQDRGRRDRADAR